MLTLSCRVLCSSWCSSEREVFLLSLGRSFLLIAVVATEFRYFILPAGAAAAADVTLGNRPLLIRVQ